MKSCIVLCGGESRRMGEDKGSLIIHKKPMIIHILDKLNYKIDELVIVLNDNDRIAKYKKFIHENKYSFSIKFCKDKIKNKGPIAGLMTGLNNIASDYALVLPCDNPEISQNFIKEIFNKINTLNKDALIVFNDTHCEPLHSVYSKKNYNLIKKLISENKLDFKSLIKKIDYESINIDIDFKNINSRKDLKTIR